MEYRTSFDIGERVVLTSPVGDNKSYVGQIGTIHSIDMWVSPEEQGEIYVVGFDDGEDLLVYPHEMEQYINCERNE